MPYRKKTQQFHLFVSNVGKSTVLLQQLAAFPNTKGVALNIVMLGKEEKDNANFSRQTPFLSATLGDPALDGYINSALVNWPFTALFSRRKAPSGTKYSHLPATRASTRSQEKIILKIKCTYNPLPTVRSINWLFRAVQPQKYTVICWGNSTIPPCSTDKRPGTTLRLINEDTSPHGQPTPRSHICNPTAVPCHRLWLERGLLHPLAQRLKLVLGVQDQQAGVICWALEERHVRVQPPTMDTGGHQAQEEGSTRPEPNRKFSLILNLIFKVQSINQTTLVQKPESLCVTYLTSLSIWRSTSLSLK